MSELQSTTTSRNDINAIFDSMNEYIVVVDRENNIIFSNRHGNENELAPNDLFESLNLSSDNTFFDTTLRQAQVEQVGKG